MDQLAHLLGQVPNGVWAFLGSAIPAVWLVRPIRRLERRVALLEERHPELRKAAA